MKTKIYMIPGFMNDERLWSRLVPLIEDKYEFIYLKIPLKDSFDEMVDEISQKIEDEKVNLMGFSLGGYIACYFGLKYPNRINKILCIACTPANLSKEECEKRASAIEFTKKFGFKGLSRKKALSIVEAQNQNDEELINILLKMYVDVGEEAFYKQFYSTIIRTDLSEKLINSNLDLGFVYAKEDRLVSNSYMNEFKNRSNGKIYFSQIEAHTHMLPLEWPNEIKDIMLEWFK